MYGTRSVINMSSAVGSTVWVILSLILAIVGGIVVYFLFLSKKNEGKFKVILRM